MKKSIVLPDFIIAGAMKCGTSSLHSILAEHPGIFIPDKEIFFYDLDDYEQHTDFFAFKNEEWHYPKFEEHLEDYLLWYSEFFEEAPENALIGEDSTTYISSENAAKRIAKLNSAAKIIIMLRDPALRCYSQYFHNVRAGRASMRFEDSIKFESKNILKRSYYKEQIENFLKYIDRDQIKFVIFEEFISNMQKVIDDILLFIGADPALLDLTKAQTHTNKHSARLSLNLNLWKNKLVKRMVMERYFGRLPWTSSERSYNKNYKRRLIEKAHKLVNPPRDQKPKINEQTHQFLDSYLKTRNKGIEELLEKKVNHHWYKTMK